MSRIERVRLVASEEEEPCVKVKANQTLRVTSVVVQGPEGAGTEKIGARLCGMSDNTCVALIDIDEA